VKGVVALRVPNIRVGAMGDEQLYDVEVAITSCPLHGCGNEISAEGIDLCTLLEEVATGGDLSIDGRPMEGSDILLIAVRSPSATGLYELSDDVEVPALGGHENIGLLSIILSD
jgi:hypothetical protein